MQTNTITPAASNAPLSDYIFNQQNCEFLVLQAPSTNGGTIYWGYGSALHQLAATDIVTVPGTNLNTVKVRGNGTDTLIVSLT